MNTSLKNFLNRYKRRFFKFLTSTFKNSPDIFELSKVDINSIKRVLVTRPNHRLGNQLLITPLIQAIEKEFPHAKIDLLVNGTLSDVIFENYSCVDKIYALPKKPFKHLGEYISKSYKVITTKYDVAIVGIESSNSSKIFVKLSKSRFKIYNSENNSNSPVHIAKIPVDSFWSVLDRDEGMDHFPKLDIRLTDKEILAGHDIISGHFDHKQSVIAIFTNATGRKKLSKEWWKELCSALEKHLPSYHILEILPKENTSQVDFKYKSFLSNDIREMAGVIENCAAIICADSGVMHLATSTSTLTFGLFNGITDSEVYGPYGKNKFTIETHKTSIDQLVKQIRNSLN
jgi:ADP-heptose:LPS heptosyltransferase